MEIVGVMLVHNEDVFVEQALRNAAGFCDRIHVADHMSTDGTWEIVQDLAAELGNVDVTRVRATGDSQALVEGYAGSETWVFGIDGDELYDATALACFRADLLGGAHQEHFSLKGNVLHVAELDRAEERATGYLAPPSRSVTKLFNFAAIDSWTRCYRQYMHDGEIAFRAGYSRESLGLLGERLAWEESPFRCLHTCFLARSSLDTPERAAQGRPSPIDLGGKKRTRATALLDRVRPMPAASAWKEDKYRQGELVTKDASPFFP